MISFRIGIDGGATKTECMLVDRAGEVVWRHETKGCNPNVIGPDKARATVQGVLAAARAEASARGGETIEATLFCMAGVPAMWREFAANLTGFGRTRAEIDSAPVLELATGGEPGLAIHAGTGSFVAARGTDSTVYFAGGTGWRFGDSCSGYDLGRLIVGRALLELQGWYPKTCLSEIVVAHTNLQTAADITRHYYQDAEPNRTIGSVSRELWKYAEQGNQTALGVVLESCRPLVALAEAVATKLFPEVPKSSLKVGLTGPILTRSCVFTLLKAQTELVLVPHTESPAEGVRRLLVKM